MDGEIIIKKAETMEDALRLESLAETVWTEHYSPIIGPEQVKYMLGEFQSAVRIYRDMSEGGYIYFTAFIGGKAAGYCAVRPDEAAGGVFLSKLYVEKSFRGRGISRRFMKLLAELAFKRGCGHIWLTVNKHNSGSIAAYKKMGFTIVEDIVTDIGGGFVMDDYKMRLELGAHDGAERETVRIERAEEGDLEEILALQKLAYLSEAQLYNDFSIPPLRETLDDLRRKAEADVVLKAVAGGRTVGSVRGFEKDGTCHIGRLVVHPDHQNRGIGSRLLAGIQSCFEGARYELFTGHRSQKNLALYEKHGFRRYKTEQAGENLTLVYLEKKHEERKDGA